MGRRTLGAVLVTALLTGCGTGSRPATPLSDRYGVNAQALLLLPAADQRRQIAAIAATGIRAVRIDVPWQEVEPSHGHVRTARVDAVVGALADAGIRVHPVLDYSARWASSVAGETLALPADRHAFAAFATLVVRRWGTRGSFWRGRSRALPFERYEIWNEPNLAFFSRGGVDPAAYARLVVAARGAIIAADPAAETVLGGLAQGAGPGDVAPAEFLAAALTAQPAMRGAIDAVGLHVYVHDAGALVSAVDELSAALDAEGLRGLPVELSEWGPRAPAPVRSSRRCASGSWPTARRRWRRRTAACASSLCTPGAARRSLSHCPRER